MAHFNCILLVTSAFTFWTKITLTATRTSHFPKEFRCLLALRIHIVFFFFFCQNPYSVSIYGPIFNTTLRPLHAAKNGLYLRTNSTTGRYSEGDYTAQNRSTALCSSRACPWPSFRALLPSCRLYRLSLSQSRLSVA